jgi:hypothetical protein
MAIRTLSPIMGRFLEEWHSEPPNLRSVLKEIDKTVVNLAR